MVKNFWHSLDKPIIALAPMDGVTDAAYRYMADLYGKPAALFTEFTSVEGIDHGAYKLLYSFISHQTETPVIGQIFGSTPAAFYKAAIVLCELGFDGIDINMGCPAKSVSQKGAGAGLINTPRLAQEIVRQTKKAAADWLEGQTIEKIDLKPEVIDFIKQNRKRFLKKKSKKNIPVSVKTRIGYENITTEQWISSLLEAQPALISLHGRTFRQLYTGEANWEEIGKAAILSKKTGVLLLGNGDIKSIADAYQKIKTYNTDGALIGRSAFGNPWIFGEKKVDFYTRLSAALQHSEAFMELTPELNFLSLRKHLAWYCKGMENAVSLRVQLLRTKNVEETKKIVNEFIKSEPSLAQKNKDQ